MAICHVDLNSGSPIHFPQWE